MYSFLLQFGIGLVILLFSTHKLVELAKNISHTLRISPLIVGITVVAIGTSLPELAVSLVAVIKNDVGLAVGNIIGSNIVNILMVFPVGLFIGKLRIGTTKTQRNALFLLGATAIFFVTQSFGSFKSISGWLLIGLAVAISMVEYTLGIFGRTHEDVKQFKSTKYKRLGCGVVVNVTLLLIGIIGGSVLVVNSVEAISLLTGISTTILGLTIIAVATSLPELLTTIFSQEDHQEKITVGNILGSNIYNLLLIGGIVSLFSSSAAIQQKEWIWLTVVTLGFVAILRYYKGKNPPRWIGIILMLLFLVYLLFQQI